MRPVSVALLDALTGSHRISTRVQVVPAGQTGTEPTGGLLVDHIGGDVTLDGGADIRSTCEVEITPYAADTGDRLWPDSTTAPLTPYGANELFIERGVELGGGAIEYVSLGYFRINDVEQPDAPNGTIRISGADRMAMIVDATFTDPVQFTSTQTYGEVVEWLVTDAYTGAVIEWEDEAVRDSPIGRAIAEESNRYSLLATVITGLGMNAYFDHRGVFVIIYPPAGVEPSWVVSRGRGGVLVSAARSISRSGVYNGVIATGDAVTDDAPAARGLAVDSNPDSPTLWGGPFGKVPRSFSSPLLTTDAMAQLAASTVLRRSIGLPYNVDFTAVPNPALEPDDIIAIGLKGTPYRTPPQLTTADSFTRTVVNGADPSEDGFGWSSAAGADTTIQVNGGVLRKTLGSNGSGLMLRFTAQGLKDVDQYLDVQVPNAAATASLVMALIFRYGPSDGNFYAARLEFDTSGNVSTKFTDGWNGPALVYYNGYRAYTAATWWTMRCRAKGGQIAFKAWPTADGQPEEWTWVYEDDPAIRLQGAGGSRFGMGWWRVGSNSNAGPQFLNDNYQSFTVPESALHGGELHVIDTVTIPMLADAEQRGTTREQTLGVIEVS